MPPPAATPSLRYARRNLPLGVTSRTSVLRSGKKYKGRGGEPNSEAATGATSAAQGFSPRDVW
jgi:hypothetical protein